MRRSLLSARSGALLLSLAVLASAQPATSTLPRQTFRNPVLDVGQDPSVVFDGAFYHLVQSDQDGLSVRTSLTLTGLGRAKKTVIWRGGQGDSPCCELWAPELVRWGDKWYVYYAADDGRNENHRMYVLEAPSVTGPYTFKGKISDSSDRWAIDGTVLRAPSGERYFVWSGWEGTENVEQDLYIAKMRNPWTLEGGRVRISRPDQPWEQNGRPYINEGPEVLVRDGRVFLAYSASGSWTNDYCLGLLSLDKGGDVMNAAAWKKSNGCVFARNDRADVYGPGHNGFVKSPDGSEDWHLYHANLVYGSGWNGRSVRAQKLTWNANGTPNFGAPVGFEQTSPLPSGEYEVEQAKVSGTVSRESSFASGGVAARFDDEGDRVDLDVTAPSAGRYVLRVRFSNGSGKAAAQTVTVNGAPNRVAYPASGWESYGTRTLTVALKSGLNTVAFTQVAGDVQLDAVTITPSAR
ncbi:family 43 glycosylhydrolase [Deinococcus yavapaiensis]|uniref:GH43 family beta-xylosidase n=1 Tax=Deinococcus yavapaiensis KR-236 TaxID=694435 RepID=A0A318S5U6_9DEIO|nr:family 43 glycosylhydrolase [Deinococcus yavapaiensis]PYE49383.1 GH43 family beta-xylosidase [Deinococcus yavapaiensis KR-236]